MSATKFQFQIDGRAFGAALRDTWEEAAKDAVDAGYGVWRSPTSVKLDEQAAIAQVAAPTAPVKSNLYRVEVAETVVTRRSYVIGAASPEEAQQKALIGDTVTEVDLKQGEVHDRLLLTIPVKLS